MLHSLTGVLGNLYFGLSLNDSVEHLRVHDQLQPDTVEVEGTYVTVRKCVHAYAVVVWQCLAWPESEQNGSQLHM